MRRFDVCPIKGSRAELVVVLQHDSTSHLNTCIVAPLVLTFAAEIEPKVRPIVLVEGRRMQLQTDRLAAISRKGIGMAVGSVEQDQDAIKYALDLLFIGF